MYIGLTIICATTVIQLKTVKINNNNAVPIEIFSNAYLKNITLIVKERAQPYK